MDIRGVRKPLRVSRDELAFRSGIGRYKLYQFEFGFDTPTEEEEGRIRQALLEIARQRSVSLHLQLQ